METKESANAQPGAQPKRPYRRPHLQDYGTVQGVTASGFGSINEAGQPSPSYASST